MGYRICLNFPVCPACFLWHGMRCIQRDKQGKPAEMRGIFQRQTRRAGREAHKGPAVPASGAVRRTFEFAERKPPVFVEVNGWLFIIGTQMIEKI